MEVKALLCRTLGDNFAVTFRDMEAYLKWRNYHMLVSIIACSMCNVPVPMTGRC